MGRHAIDLALLRRIEQLVMQIGWLDQRQCMQLLAEERFDLTLPQFYTLLQLSNYTEGCNMSDLARATYQSAASLTGIVDRLREKQLVIRGQLNGDRRQVQIVLTEQGHTLIQAIQHARNAYMQSTLSSFSNAQLPEFARLLDILLAGIMHQCYNHE